MQLSDVASILDQSTAGKTLTLPADAFGDGTAVAQLLTAYLTGEQLVVKNAVQVTTAKAITVEGTGGNAPFTGMSVMVQFSVDGGGNAVLAAIATAPTTGWTLATAFPLLAPTLVAGLTFSGTQGFYLASAPTDIDARGVHLAQGLHFKGTLALDGALENFRWLLGGATTLDVEGPVEIHEGVPEMEIGATVLKGVTLGWFALRSVRLEVVSRLYIGVPVATGGEWGAGQEGFPTPTVGADACFRLSSEVVFQSGQTAVGIPIAAEFYDTPGAWIAFEADLNAGVLATIDALTSLVDGYPLGNLVAAAGQTLQDNVRLSTLVIQLDPSAAPANVVTSVSLGVGTAQPWVLARGTVAGVEDAPVVVMTDLELVFRVYNPLGASPDGRLFVFGLVTISGARMQVSAVYPDFAVSGVLGPGDGVDLADAVRSLLRQPVPDAPSLRLTEFAFDAAPGAGTYSASAEVTSDWKIPIGPVDVVVRDVYGSVAYDGSTATGAIGGVLAVGDATVKMDWALPGDFVLGGVVPSLDVKTLVQQFSSDADAVQTLVGAFPSVPLTNTHLYVARYQNGGAFVAAGATSPTFGTFEVAFQQAQGHTGFVFGFALPPDWTLSQLSSAFDVAALNALIFHQASLVVASYTDPDFQFRLPDAPGTPITGLYAPDGVVEGALLHAELLFADVASGPVAFVGQLLPDTVTGLTLDATIRADDFAETTFAAQLNGTALLVGTGMGSDKEVSVTAQNLSLRVKPGQLEADLHLELRFVLYGNAQSKSGKNILVLAGDVEIAGAQAAVRVATMTPWVEPFGIRGLTLNQMGVEITVGAQVRLTLAGGVTLGSGSSAVTLDAAAEFNITAEGVPDVLKVHEAGTVNLGLVVAAFVGSGRVPSDLNQIELYAFDLLIVANPAGWTNPTDNRAYPAGLAFSGSLRFFGLVGTFGLQVSYRTGLYATGRILNPIQVGPLKLASVTSRVRGPSATINTGASPYLTLDAALSFYEIYVTVVAEISSGAFLFEFSTAVTGLGTLHVRATLTNGRVFAFDADLALAFGETLTISVAPNRTLCTLRLDVVLAAHVAISAGPGPLLSLRLAADFTFDGYRVVLPDTRFTGSLAGLTSLSALPSFFAHLLGDQLWNIAGTLLQDVDAFFSYAAREVNAAVRFAENVGEVLAHDYRVALDKAGYLLKSVSSQMQYDASKVAALLENGYNAAAHAVATALRDAEYEAEEVATALYDAFTWSAHKADEEIAAVLHAAGYGLDEVAAALRGAFGWAADEVASFFKKTWHVADTVVHDALKVAGYAVSAVEDAMKSAYGWVAKGVTSLKDTVKKW